jgi:hypothetical protein
MKLLLTADLHFRVHWFRWLIEQAQDFDLVCIAGKLRGEGSRTLAEAKKTRKFPCTILTGQLSRSRETGRQYQTDALANRR